MEGGSSETVPNIHCDAGHQRERKNEDGYYLHVGLSTEANS